MAPSPLPPSPAGSDLGAVTRSLGAVGRLALGEARHWSLPAQFVIHLFNLTILYQPERIIVRKLLFRLEACLPLTKPHAGLWLLTEVILRVVLPLVLPGLPASVRSEYSSSS